MRLADRQGIRYSWILKQRWTGSQIVLTRLGGLDLSRRRILSVVVGVDEGEKRSKCSSTKSETECGESPYVQRSMRGSAAVQA